MSDNPGDLKPVLARLAAGLSLSEAEAEAAFGIIMAGEATPAQIAGMLMAMRVRRETVAELTGAVRAMRARMSRVATRRSARPLAAKWCARRRRCMARSAPSSMAAAMFSQASPRRSRRRATTA